MLNDTADNETLAWAKDTLAEILEEILKHGIIESPLVESRPAWARLQDVVIGQLRDQGAAGEYLWVIGGSVPIDCVHSGVATTPRDAARHFSMKWQLEAARYEDPLERQRFGLDPAVDWHAQAQALIAKAEYLYSLVDDDQNWS